MEWGELGEVFQFAMRNYFLAVLAGILHIVLFLYAMRAYEVRKRTRQTEKSMQKGRSEVKHRLQQYRSEMNSTTVPWNETARENGIRVNFTN